jgi:hypothetical protein
MSATYLAHDRLWGFQPVENFPAEVLQQQGFFVLGEYG